MKQEEILVVQCCKMVKGEMLQRLHDDIMEKHLGRKQSSHISEGLGK